jgi:predicted DNA-binding transcriptional regulator AlpA
MPDTNDVIEKSRLIGEAERRRLTGISRSAWYELERAGRVPRRVSIMPGKTGWRLADLLEWVAQRPIYDGSLAAPTRRAAAPAEPAATAEGV